MRKVKKTHNEEKNCEKCVTSGKKFVHLCPQSEIT